MSKQKYRKILIVIFVISFLFTGYFSYRVIDKEIPDEVNVFAGDDIVIKSSLPISYDTTGVSLETAATSGESLIKCYSVKTKLFGIIPVKEVEVNVIAQRKLIPCGFQIGIYLHTEGVMIIDTGEVTDINGMVCSPAKNIVKANDYVVSLNDIPVNTKSQLMFLINKYGSEDIVLGIRRNEQLIQVQISPVCTAENQYKAGIWVRDDSQGIGTLTYLTEEGTFAGLGHGISDVDTGKLLSSKNGILYDADIWGIKKGENGNPGGLLGSIAYEEANELGTITGNTNCGIFGIANEKLIEKCDSDSVEIALKQDVKVGKAIVRCAINGELCDYEIEIEKVDYANNKKNKGMVIRITDPKLLSQTNGIVQGMSGSPILQDGKLIGAVTHVFVNDSTRGYGIFIEEMLEHN